MAKGRLGRIMHASRYCYHNGLFDTWRYLNGEFFRVPINRIDLVIPYLRMLSRDYDCDRAYLKLSFKDEHMTFELKKSVKDTSFTSNPEKIISSVYFSRERSLDLYTSLDEKVMFVSGELYDLFKSNETPDLTPIFVGGYKKLPGIKDTKYCLGFKDENSEGSKVQKFVMDLSFCCDERKKGDTPTL